MIILCGITLGVFVVQPRSGSAKILADIPDRDVRYADTFSPAWKKTWDNARQLYRDRKIAESRVQYEVLLAQKENVDAARWEYVSLLLELQQWQEAGRNLEYLLTHDPHNRQYLLAAARVAHETGNPEKEAVSYLRILETATAGKGEEAILVGLNRALGACRSVDRVLPELERLAAQRPDDKILQNSLAGLLLQAGKPEEAQDVYARLEPRAGDGKQLSSMQVLPNAGSWVHKERLGTRKDLSPPASPDQSGIGVIGPAPADVKARLDDVEELLRSTPSDPVLLEQAADLNLIYGRVDAALRYYDTCLSLCPDKDRLREKRKGAQRVLARDLLPLVENGGSEKLWKDLALLTSDRQGVFRQMAELLRQRNSSEELVVVLSLLAREEGRDTSTFR